MLQVGTKLNHGRWVVLEQIGEGGMGTVYKVSAPHFDDKVFALKAVRAADFQQSPAVAQSLRKAFKEEKRRLVELPRHPALVGVYDYFEEEEGQYLVMEYIEGKDLATQLEERGHPFAVEQVLHWADQLLDALAQLHSLSPPLIHRDIKPQNLKLRNAQQIVLLDFGIAKGGLSQTTVSKMLQGSHSPSYAPPE